MADNKSKNEKESLRETIQLEREALREKIRELIDSEYAELEAEAERIAPGFDYAAEAEALKAEEAEELARASFAWDEEPAPEDTEAEAAAVAEPEGAEPTDEETETEVAEAPAPQEPKPLPPAKVSRSKYPKPRREYKTAAGRALFGDRHRRTVSAAVLMLAAFAAFQAWDYLVPKTVNISYVTYAGTEKVECATTARTVGEMVEDLKAGDDSSTLSAAAGAVNIGKNDLLDTAADMPVRSDLNVGIRQATESSAKIAGKKQKLWLVPGTVEENLRLNGIAFDEDDEISPALNKKVSGKTSIKVNEVHYDVKEKTEKVEAVDRVVLDPSLTSGVQETSEGNDGEGVFTYTTKYVNGKKKGTERNVKEWITEPHDNVLRLGTSATGNSGEYIVDRTFTANTTAYTARAGARGALGMGVHVGTCAVDPGFVSLRSELWVEGYGYAFANDTGGAVKGNVVDLYMSSRGQCISWGRRNVTAYVLVPAE